MLSFLLLFLYSLFDNGKNLSRLISSGGDYFFDYTYHILSANSLKNIYDSAWSVFPPLSYIMYNILYKVINEARFFDLTAQNAVLFAKDSHLNFVSILITVIQILLLCFSIQKLFSKYNDKYKYILPLFISISVPVMFLGIWNGNSVVICMIFIIVGIFLADSDDKLLSEISLISIAVASALKVYPALLGLFFVKRKEWNKIIRLILYGVLFMFIPFIFTSGENIVIQIGKFLTNIINMSNLGGYHNYISIISIFELLFKKIGWHMGDIVSSCIINAYLFLMIALFYISKNKYYDFFFLIVAFTHYSKNAWNYNLVYYVPLFLLFIYQNDNKNKLNIFNIIITIIYSLIFSPWCIIIAKYKYNIALCYLLIFIHCIQLFKKRGIK